MKGAIQGFSSLILKKCAEGRHDGGRGGVIKSWTNQCLKFDQATLSNCPFTAGLMLQLDRNREAVVEEIYADTDKTEIFDGCNLNDV
jgi:hypothetical protein